MAQGLISNWKLEPPEQSSLRIRNQESRNPQRTATAATVHSGTETGTSPCGKWVEATTSKLLTDQGASRKRRQRKFDHFGHVLVTFSGVSVTFFSSLLCRATQEPNRNQKPEPSEPFFPKPKAEPEPPEPFFQEPKPEPNRSLLLNCTETQKNLFAEEPPEPKTGTGRTVPPPNRNRTEPNRGHPVFITSLPDSFCRTPFAASDIISYDVFRMSNMLDKTFLSFHGTHASLQSAIFSQDALNIFNMFHIETASVGCTMVFGFMSCHVLSRLMGMPASNRPPTTQLGVVPRKELCQKSDCGGEKSDCNGYPFYTLFRLTGGLEEKVGDLSCHLALDCRHTTHAQFF